MRLCLSSTSLIHSIFVNILSELEIKLSRMSFYRLFKIRSRHALCAVGLLALVNLVSKQSEFDLRPGEIRLRAKEIERTLVTLYRMKAEFAKCTSTVNVVVTQLFLTIA